MTEYEKEPQDEIPEMGERDEEDRGHEIPRVEPGLEEIVPTPGEDKKPEISPEERQEIIDHIEGEEKEEQEREEEVDRIIEEVRKKKELG